MLRRNPGLVSMFLFVLGIWVISFTTQYIAIILPSLLYNNVWHDILISLPAIVAALYYVSAKYRQQRMSGVPVGEKNRMYFVRVVLSVMYVVVGWICTPLALFLAAAGSDCGGACHYSSAEELSFFLLGPGTYVAFIFSGIKLTKNAQKPSYYVVWSLCPLVLMLLLAAVSHFKVLI